MKTIRKNNNLTIEKKKQHKRKNENASKYNHATNCHTGTP